MVPGSATLGRRLDSSSTTDGVSGVTGGTTSSGHRTARRVKPFPRTAKRLGTMLVAVLAVVAVDAGLVTLGPPIGIAAASPRTANGHKPAAIKDLANPTSSASSELLAGLFPVNSADWSAGMKLADFTAAIRNMQFDPCLQAKGFPLPPGPQVPVGGNNLTFPNLSQIATVGFTGPTTVIKTARGPTTNTTPSYQQAYQATEKTCNEAVEDPLSKFVETFHGAGSLGAQWIGIVREINRLPSVTKAMNAWKRCMARTGIVVSSDTAFFGLATRTQRSSPKTQVDAREKHLAAVYAKCFQPVESLRVRLRTQRRNSFFAEHAEEIDAAMRRVGAIVSHLSSKYHTPFEAKRSS